MVRYRIKREVNGRGECSYQPQRKLFWFIPFWEDIGVLTSPCTTKKGALEIIQHYKDTIDNVDVDYL